MGGVAIEGDEVAAADQRGAGGDVKEGGDLGGCGDGGDVEELEFVTDVLLCGLGLGRRGSRRAVGS
ncbi:hypothetical protein [Acrocarpospora sp. B8E8]|uniref:hypothetical protein n=1 Tax=Acrocarpospora sp. B8E8 TaxID=3153572 RepID=UPI00325F7334